MEIVKSSEGVPGFGAGSRGGMKGTDGAQEIIRAVKLFQVILNDGYMSLYVYYCIYLLFTLL